MLPGGAKQGIQGHLAGRRLRPSRTIICHLLVLVPALALGVGLRIPSESGLSLDAVLVSSVLACESTLEGEARARSIQDRKMGIISHRGYA